MKGFRWLGALVVAAMLALSGCADDAGVSNNAVVLDVTTLWLLENIDGAALPHVVEVETGVPVEVVAARLVMEPTGAWVLRYDYRAETPTATREGSAGITGTYEPSGPNGAALRMVDAETQETYAGDYDGAGVLLMTLRGHRYRFKFTH